jgi:hypothetical protein
MRIYDIIQKKRDKTPLDSEEIYYAVNGFTNGEIPDYQMSALLMAIYLIGYSIGQFAVFFLRTEPLVLGGLKQAQVTALVVLIAGVVLSWWLRTHPEEEFATERKLVGPPKGPARLRPKRKRR